MGVRPLFAVIAVAMILAIPILALEPADVPIEVPDQIAQVEYRAPVDPIVAPAHGDVVLLPDGDAVGVYVELGSSDLRYAIEFDELIQGPVAIGVPVIWTQTGRISTEEDVIVNLWNHDDAIIPELLTDLTSIVIALNGTPVSEVPLFSVPAGTWEFAIEYESYAVEQDVTCETLTVEDFIPPGAQIISSDLPLDTPIQERCTITLSHEGSVRYEGVEPDLSGIDLVAFRLVEPNDLLIAR